jgi:hypothetical protein
VFAFILLVLHHAIAAVDLLYANPKRRIAPREQMVHSFLEIMPLTAYILLAILYRPQFLLLFGKGPEAAAFSPLVRPLPVHFVLLTLASAFVLNLLPYTRNCAGA